MLEYLLNNPEIPIVVVILAVAVISLFRINTSYNTKAQADRDAAQKLVIENLDKSHEETMGLMREQTIILKQELEEEKAARRTIVNEYQSNLEQVANDYKQFTAASLEATRNVQVSLGEQVILLKEIAGLPSKVDKIQQDVNELWKLNRAQQINMNGGNNNG